MLKAILRRWVFRASLKDGSVLACRMCLGREFQRDGVATEKAQEQTPDICCLIIQICNILFVDHYNMNSLVILAT